MSGHSLNREAGQMDALYDAQRIGTAAARGFVNAGTLERDRQLVALKAAAPMRSGAGRVIQDQHDAGHLPLFIAANEPSLF